MKNWSSATSGSKPERNAALEGRERLSYIILQHVDSLATADDGQISARRVISNLGLPMMEGLAAIRHLAKAELIEWDRIDSVQLREEGREYLERGARRRRSVRVTN